MKRVLIFIVVVYLSLISGGCVIKYEDVSKEPEYAPLINTRYSLSTSMLIQGINLPPGYGPEIDVYSITPISMRTEGPEIITTDVLKSEAVLKVKCVERSTISIPFEGIRIIATVEVEPFEKEVKIPVEVDLAYLQSTNYMQKLEL